MKKQSLNYKLTLLMGLLFILLLTSKAQAAPSRKAMIELMQPTGQRFNAIMQGDEWLNWAETPDGYVLLKNLDGFWDYSEIINGKLVPGEKKYLIDKRPSSIVKNDDVLKIWKSYHKNIKGNISSKNFLNSLPNLSAIIPINEKHPLLVMLVEFDDINIRYSQTEWYNQFFGESVDSVNSYFKEISNGKFYFDTAKETYGKINDGIVKVKLSYNHPNRGGNTDIVNQRIVKDAINAADNYIDFSTYDKDGNGQLSIGELHIVTIIAGYESSYGQDKSPSIWGHRWSLYGSTAVNADGVGVAGYPYGGYTQQGEIHGGHMATIGVLCHELGHDLGLPDLYDSDYSSFGVGIHSLMATGSWASTVGSYEGSSPTNLDPWSKTVLGFIVPKVVDKAGVYELNSIATGNYGILKILTQNPYEYFLIENRQIEGYDNGLSYSNASGGIAIWHIDEKVIIDNDYNYVNDNELHKGVDIEEANEAALGYSQLDKGLYGYKLYNHYYSISGNSKFGTSTLPNSNLYNGARTNVTINIIDPSSESMKLEIFFNEKSESPISFKDKNLEKAIRDTLKIFDRELTIGDIELLYELNGDNYDINNLEGLEFAVNLMKLSLRYNAIEDISLIQQLFNLEHLYLDGNKISNIKPLSKLNKLKELSISNYKESYIDKDSNSRLNLFYNVMYSENKNTIKDFTPLKDLISLKVLNINGTNCSDISFLGELINLQEIYAGGNNIANISYLYLLKGLKTVYLQNNNISNIEILNYLNQIQILDLGNNELSTITTLGNLSNLEYLSVDGNRINDISPLYRLQNLKSLSSSANKIIDIKALKSLTNLKKINLSRNNIKDITSVIEIKNLIWLDLSENNITDIKPIVLNHEKGSLPKNSFINLTNNNLNINQGSKVYQNIQCLINEGIDVLYSPQKAMLEVIGTVPSNEQKKVDLNSQITITFSQPIASGNYFNKIYLKNSGGGNISIDKIISDNILTIKPKSLLKGDTEYFIYLPAKSLMNQDELSLAADYTFNFTTLDNIAPSAIRTLPLRNSKDIAVKSFISIYFNENVSESVNLNNIVLYDNLNNKQNIKCFINDNELKIIPENKLKYNTKYYIKLPSASIEDIEGNKLLNEYSLNFTTENKFEVVSAIPNDGSKMVNLKKEIIIRFNKKIKTGDGFNQITLKGDNRNFKIDFKISGTSLIIKPYIGLKPSTTYTLSIPYNALADYNQNVLLQDFTLNFSSGRDYYFPRIILSNSTESKTVLYGNTNYTLDFLALDESGVKEIKITGKNFSEIIFTENNFYIPEINIKKTLDVPKDALSKFQIEVTDVSGKKYTKTIYIYTGLQR